MRIYLFEGPDKVGKTTAIKRFSEELIKVGKIPFILNIPYEITKITPQVLSARLAFTAQEIQLLSDAYNDNYILLIDRLHISEAVYGPMLRDFFNEELFNDIDELLHSKRVRVIFMFPDNDFGLPVFEKFQVDGKLDGFTKEQYQKTIDMFVEIIENKTKLHCSQVPIAFRDDFPKTEAELLDTWVENEIYGDDYE